MVQEWAMAHIESVSFQNLLNTRQKIARMSRYTGEEQSEQILKAASEWRQHCLINGGSLFSNKNLWNSQYLAKIERDVVNSQLSVCWATSAIHYWAELH